MNTNNMKTIKIQDKEFILVEVPEDAYDFRYKLMPDNTEQLVASIKDEDGNIGRCYFRDNPKGKILGKLSDEKCRIFVEGLQTNDIDCSNSPTLLLIEKKIGLRKV